LNSFLDTVVGACLSRLGDVALSSWGTYRLLYLPILQGGFRDWASAARARAVYWNARTTVPAYREFLRAKGAEGAKRFQDIPPMDKDSYIRKWALEQTCQGGRLPERGAVIDESSGSTGTATNWLRGEHERYATRRLIQFSARATFGDASFIMLNTFALGPWATGMNVSMSLVDRCVLKSIGPDAKKLIASLELLGPKYRYVISGYPPFLKSVVDNASLDWSQYDICAVVGGEGMSEPLRAALNKCFRKTVSSFGASDLEINMAVETDFTTALRQAIASNAALGRDLFGEHESLPMIFQYDPLNYFIESDADRNLLFTLNRVENVSPRIRYNIHDRGIVLPVARVLEVLESHRVKLDPFLPRVRLPLLFHWGRQEHAVAFYGCKITPEDVQNVILRIPALAEHTGDFALHPFEDERANKRLEVWLEAKAGAKLPEAEAIEADFFAELARLNQDFRESIKMVPEAHRPRLKVYGSGTSPLAGQDPRIKKRYIV
jgi:phenylacetate-CoA ligase